MRSENWEGVRVESAAMIVDVDVSSIGITCLWTFAFQTMEYGGGRRMWLFMYLGESVCVCCCVTDYYYNKIHN